MKVNIVMLVHNRQHLTEQTLTTLYTNTPHDMYNLTIIDDGSHSFGWIPTTAEVTVLRIDPSMHITGMARNLGVYWAEKYWGRGEYLYLSDNDVFFTRRWLDRLCSDFEALELGNRNFKILGGWNHPYLRPNGDPVRLYFGEDIYEHDAVAGASQLMRWETWDKYGPLDAHAKGVGQSEDWAFCQKIVKDGGRVGSVYPRIIYNCGLTNSFGEPSPGANVMLKELQEAKKQYPELYWE